MAFVPGSIAEKYLAKPVPTAGGFAPGSIAGKYLNRDRNVSSIAGTLSQEEGFVPGSIAGKYIRASSKDVDTSTGLYNLAVQSGLQGRADEILKQQQGEETKKFFSGGYISDIFDVLNAAQYGVVGLLKGKSF